ncbi:MAG: DUF1330 domain-containing protein [Methylobacteriaceae bacterium]|nr:DUF1330 domain-containing protein [Methylobacteriaceae bacterium]
MVRAVALAFVVTSALIAASQLMAQEARAPAYVVVQSISVTDQAAFERYQALARDTIARHGGRFLSRGANVQFLEGQGDFSRVGLIEFPSMAAANDWFKSPEFQEAMKVRRTAGEQRIFLIEGRSNN